MTERQKFKFYFPAWHECCAANHWRMLKGQLVIDAERLTDEGRKVLALARQRALAEARAPKVDDLRHAAHIVALGRDKSSEHLTNAEVDRVVCLFKLLTDPEDLDAVMKWQAYERGEDPGAARRVDWFIQHAAPDAYVRAISADKFGSRMWEYLEPYQKQELARTLSERRRAKQRPMQPQSHRGAEVLPDGRNAKLETPELKLETAPAGARTYQMDPHKVYVKGPF